VRFLSNHCPYASAYDGGKVARVYSNAEMTEHEIGRHCPQDLIGWRDAVAFFNRMSPAFLPLHTTTLPSAPMFRQLARIIMGRPSDTFALGRLIVESPRQFVNRNFHSPEVKGLFTPWAFHLDYGPNVRGGATFAFVAAMSAYLRGIKIVEGGAGCLDRYEQWRGGTTLVGGLLSPVEPSRTRHRRQTRLRSNSYERFGYACAAANFR
jgi:phytoene dehydrogenase-like protein